MDKIKVSSKRAAELLAMADDVLNTIAAKNLPPNESIFIIMAAAYKYAHQTDAPEDFLRGQLETIERMGRG